MTVDKTIYALSDRSTNTTDSDNCTQATFNSSFKYCLYKNKNGLTLLKDTPIFIDSFNKTSEIYNTQPLVSISVGIDGSIWGLEWEADVKDYQLLKW